MKKVSLKRPAFVAAIGLLLLAVTGRIDLSSPFIGTTSCGLSAPFGCTYKYFQTNEFGMFILFMIVALIGWSYFETRKK